MSIYLGFDYEISEIAYAAARGDIEQLKEALHKQPNALRTDPLALVMAAGDRRADVKVLDFILSKGADINASAGDIKTCPLSASIGSGSFAKAKFLVERGANIHYKHSGPGLWLNLAYCFGPDFDQLVDFFLPMGVSFEPMSEYGETATRVASKFGRFDFLRRMLSAGASSKPLRWNNLLKAVVCGSTQDVEQALTDGQSEIWDWDHHDRSPWMLAVETGSIQKAELLLDAGVSLEEEDRHGENALHKAAACNQAKMLSWLLSKGLKVDSRDANNNTPLASAAVWNATECMQILLNNGADPTAKGELYDQPLAAASKIEAISLLANNGAKINTVFSDGYFPLKSAAEDNDLVLTQKLLALGADPDLTSTGDTALHKAFVHDYLDIAECLIKAGANVNAQDCDMCSILHDCKSKRAIDLAMRAGVDSNLFNCIGQTAAESLPAALGSYLRNRRPNR